MHTWEWLTACFPIQALEEAKTRDRLYIPSRYQLFTLNQVRQVRCQTNPPAWMRHFPNVALLKSYCWPVRVGAQLVTSKHSCIKPSSTERAEMNFPSPDPDLAEYVVVPCRACRHERADSMSICLNPRFCTCNASAV